MSPDDPTPSSHAFHDTESARAAAEETLAGEDHDTSLPRGFRFRAGAGLWREAEIVRLFLRRAELMSFSPLRIPPVGFSATFKKGAHIAEGKIFEFNDRRGRTLALTADATAAILARYCSRGDFGLDERLAYISPTFRYRRLRQRHYTQLGLAYINPNISSPNEVDHPTLLVTAGLCKFIAQDLRIPITVELNDFRIIRHRLLGVFGDEGRADEAMHAMRRMDEGGRRAWFSGQGVPDAQAGQLLDFFSASIKIAPDGAITSAGADGELSELTSPESFPLSLSRLSRVPVVLRFGNFHGSELLSGMGVRFRVESARAIGEGGDYTRYGRNFDAAIRCFGSVAVSLERLVEYADFTPPFRAQTAIALLRLDASVSFTSALAESIRDAGFPVEENLATGKLKKHIRRVAERCHWLIIVGAAEEQSGVMRLKHLPSKTEYDVAGDEVGPRLAEVVSRRL